MLKKIRKLDNHKGFSLVEMLIVLAVLGIAFVGVTTGLSSFNQVSGLTESEKKLANIKEKLLSFAETNYYLPCPDTDNNGREDRVFSAIANTIVVDGNVLRCQSTFGTVPFLDLGLQPNEVEDKWGNRISYYVNRRADNGTDICDKTFSASYFCEEHALVTPRFTVDETPPLFNVTQPWNDFAQGDYTVCNEVPAICNNGAVNSAADQQNVSVLSASVVLVAHNKDGDEAATNLGACNYTNPISQQNCDNNRFFHQSIKTAADEATYFDDNIITITGYEIKARVNNTILSWESGGGITNTFEELAPTATTYDLDDASQIPINDDADNPDVILVNRDVTDGIDLGLGDDVLAVGNNIDAGGDTVDMGEGDDVAYTAGNILSDLVLGDGNDRVVLEGKLESNIYGGAGKDKVWVLGTISSSGSIDLGEDDDVMWFGGQVLDNNGDPIKDADDNEIDVPTDLFGNIDGGDGYDIVILEEVDSYSDLSSAEQGRLQNFELIMFKSLDESGTRNYCIPSGSDCTYP